MDHVRRFVSVRGSWCPCRQSSLAQSFGHMHDTRYEQQFPALTQPCTTLYFSPFGRTSFDITKDFSRVCSLFICLSVPCCVQLTLKFSASNQLGSFIIRGGFIEIIQHQSDMYFPSRVFLCSSLKTNASIITGKTILSEVPVDDSGAGEAQTPKSVPTDLSTPCRIK